MSRTTFFLLTAGPAVAITAFLVDARISRAFAGADLLAGIHAYYIFGAGVGVLVQGGLAWAMDRTQPRSTIPLSTGALAACGALDFVSVLAWLYALLTGPTAAVLALGSLAPVLVGGWEILVGRLGIGRGLLGIAVILLGVGCLLLPAAGTVVPLACGVALFVRNGTRALTEVWERKVPIASSYRFTGVRFVTMAALGIPCALAVGRPDEWRAIPASVVALQVLSHGLWFAVNVVRVQIKQRVQLVTLPAAAFATPAAGSALVASVLNLALPGAFPRATFSAPLVIGVLFLVAGTAWFSTARAPRLSSPT